ncbi:SARP family transcriptional regulator [Sphaerisporangium melleum]|uniref:SARP family transcriptional regulator n=1 Tax=Sphaerisporangium melleum TaxID=321316 RepID=A0A917VCP3_9ACTN|nr:tetratricopeptide repeat protein [Sphaerisporangium melleum]GGK63053.1 SARP family transcriptional regulator [Sphaerisporangium melleum]GII68040.1 SARP family transcriptional regulator [Sphaerisporangium melleum]
MEFRILGKLELRFQDQNHDFGWTKARQVMAVLLLTPGHPVSDRSLVAKLWDGEPLDAASVLRPVVSRLRRRLREIGATGGSNGELLRRISGAYILETDAENIDYHRFLRLCKDAQASAESGDIEHALRLYHDAESLWRGEPLNGLPGTWAETTRQTLQEDKLRAVTERIALELGRGLHNQLVPELHDLVARFPLDETLVELLMRALYASGRQADALSAYRRARERLVGEFAIEPSAELCDLHQRILLHDPSLAAPHPRSTSGPTAPNYLPVDPLTFTGRRGELATLTSDRVLGGTAVPVLAIDGMAGVGKTTLAVHLAHHLAPRYSDGLLYLDLQGHNATHKAVEPAAALDRLLRQLGIPGTEIPDELDTRAARWRRELAGRRVLVVLDDASGHQQIRHLLPGEPGCLVIVTSRRRLSGLEGAEPFPLEVLQPEDAAELFHRAAGTHREREPEHVTKVIRLCGHLPLAIQLVGSRLRHRPTWTVADLAARLSLDSQRLAEIRTENREISAAFELSFDALTPFQQWAFTRLGFHPGTEFTPHCVAVLLDRPLADAERFLEDLVDYHLITEPRHGRYRLHDLIRDYAVSLASRKSESERTGAVRRVLDYHLFLADRADRLLYQHRTRIPVNLDLPPRTHPDIETTDQAGTWLATELDDLLRLTRYAADHGWIRHSALFPHVLGRHLSSWGHWTEAVTLHQIAIDAWLRLDDQRGTARAMTDLGETLWEAGRLDESLGLATRALSMQIALDDQHGIAELLDLSGRVHWDRSELDVALRFLQQGLDIRRKIQDRSGVAKSLNHIAGLAHDKGDYRTASDRLREVLALHEADSDLRGRLVVLNNLGETEARLGNLSAALRNYERAATLTSEMTPKDKAGLLHNTASVLQQLGRHEEALERYQEALRTYVGIGDGRREAQTLNSIGSCYTDMGRAGQAIIHHQKALSITRELNARQEEIRALLGIGDAHDRTDRHETALCFFSEGLQVAQAIGDVHQEANCLDRMGSAAERTGDLQHARRLWQRALALYDHLEMPEAQPLRTRLRDLSEES